MPYSQALRLNRICSENSSFDKRCNELEIWLKELGCSDKLVRQPIPKARKHNRKDFLKDQKVIIMSLRSTLLITQTFLI